MKILHLYSGNLYGGVESVLSIFGSCGGEVSGLTQSFALCFHGRLWNELSTIGVPLYFLGNATWRLPWSISTARWRLKNLLLKESFDIVICHSSWILGIFGSVVKSTQSLLVFWVHDFLSGKGWIEYTASRVQPDQIIANSHYTLGSVLKQYPSIPQEVIHCPVKPASLGVSFDRLSIRQKLRQELSISLDSILIVQVSRMERWKGHTVLIEALGRLKEDPSWIAIFVGGAQRPKEELYLQELRELVQKEGLTERVRFLGQRSDVPEILAASDIFVQTNLSPEPFGMGFIEAMYAGIPVIGVATGGVKETVSQDTGILLDRPDPALLASAIQSRFSTPETEKRMRQMGPLQARAISDPVQQLSRTKIVLESLLAKSCGRRRG